MQIIANADADAWSASERHIGEARQAFREIAIPSLRAEILRVAEPARISRHEHGPSARPVNGLMLSVPTQLDHWRAHQRIVSPGQRA
jgi:hypothetical protein